MKLSKVLRFIPVSTALLLLLALFGASGAAQASPFTFEFDMPTWDFSDSSTIFGTNAVVDLTFDNGAATDLSQTYLNSQITQVSVSTVGGTFAHTWTSGFFWGPTDRSYVSTDGTGVATLDLLTSPSTSFFDVQVGGAFLQLGVLDLLGGPTTFALSDGTGASAGAVPFVNGHYTGFTVTSTNSTSVPEPATLALMGIGLVGLGLSRRRRKSASIAA